MKTQSLPFRLLRLFAGVAVIFVAIVFTINLSIFDEELSPEVARLMQPSAMPPVKNNAYYALWGLTSSSEKEPVIAGVSLIERYLENRNKRDLDEITDKDYDDILGGRNLDDSWTEQFESCNSRKEYGCLSRVSLQLKETPISDNRLVLMLERLENILEMTSFHNLDHLTVNTPLPPYGVIMKLRQIKLVNLYNQGEPSRFIHKLAKDLKFWRMILIEGNTLLDKMVAAASIFTDLQYLSELNYNHELSIEQQQAVMSLLTPLTVNEMNMQNIIENEIRVNLSLLNSWQSIDTNWNVVETSSLIFLLSQKHATMNSYYSKTLMSINCYSQMSAHELAIVLRKNKNNVADKCKINSQYSFSPINLYNLGGKLQSPFLGVIYANYIARLHDLNGMFSLVKLQLSLKQIDNHFIEEALENSNIKNPYTGELMDYDKEQGWLSFDCLDTSLSCKIKL